MVDIVKGYCYGMQSFDHQFSSNREDKLFHADSVLAMTG